MLKIDKWNETLQIDLGICGHRRDHRWSDGATSCPSSIKLVFRVIRLVYNLQNSPPNSVQYGLVCPNIGPVHGQEIEQMRPPIGCRGTPLVTGSMDGMVALWGWYTLFGSNLSLWSHIHRHSSPEKVWHYANEPDVNFCCIHWCRYL